MFRFITNLNVKFPDIKTLQVNIFFGTQSEYIYRIFIEHVYINKYIHELKAYYNGVYTTYIYMAYIFKNHNNFTQN